MNIIDQLKKNRYAWGMWTHPECYGPELGKEMQEKARGIKRNDFQCYMLHGVWLKCHIEKNEEVEFASGCTYRLRPDYTEEPEIEEIAIHLLYGTLHFVKESSSWELGRAVSYPDCIGFKFEDGSWCNRPIKPVNVAGEIVYGPILIADILSGAVIIIDATHVLFRGQK